MATPEALIDTVEAYQPMIIIGQRNFDDLATLQKTLESHDDFNPDLLATEEQKLGMRFADDPEGFLAAHNALVNDYAAYLKEVYPGVLDGTIQTLADYMGKGDAAARDRWQDILRSRVHKLSEVLALDHLMSGKHKGEMRPYSRSVLINSVFALMDPAEANPLVEGAFLPHEIMHLLSTSAVWVKAKTISPLFDPINMPARTGVSTMHPAPEGSEVDANDQASWVNEAATEDLRSRAFNADEIGYARGVALLRALKACDATLEATLDEAVLGTERPSAAVEKIENVLGPLGVDLIGPFASDKVWNAKAKAIEYKHDDETFVAQVLALTRPELRDTVEVILRHQMSQIHSMRPLPSNLISYH